MTTNIWNIDAAHSGIHFAVRHMLVSKVRGRFTKHTGTIKLEGDDLTKATVGAAIEASSIDTGTAPRDEHLRSADFFDVARFPELRFLSTRIERVADDRFRMIGLLSIREITREVALDVEYAGKGIDPWGNERIAFTAKTAIDRKDFGLTWNQALETGGVLVGDRIEIELEVQAVHAAAAKAA